jgi:hypothetical protein
MSGMRVASDASNMGVSDRYAADITGAPKLVSLEELMWTAVDSCDRLHRILAVIRNPVERIFSNGKTIKGRWQGIDHSA